ncbi:MAG TPA: hypothetical protein VGS62_09520, partial [Streptosporangiaceae bacterium]|nr:hypothetical protein [Streptosporangiaceae bacterium]
FRQDKDMAKRTPATMYDSVTWEAIPANAEVVAGYVDGDFAWPPAAWERWPGADKVLITVSGSLTGNVADVEAGDMTPAQAAEWIRAKHSAGMRGVTIYCSRSDLGAVRTACKGQAYYIWVADWTNSPHEIAGTVATQYQNVGTSYDLSMVYSQEWLDAIEAANNPWPLRPLPDRRGHGAGRGLAVGAA